MTLCMLQDFLNVGGLTITLPKFVGCCDTNIRLLLASEEATSREMESYGTRTKSFFSTSTGKAANGRFDRHHTASLGKKHTDQGSLALSGV